jgi:hypothetical protein
MMHLSLVVAASLDRLYWTTRILLQVLTLISLQNNGNEKKTRKPPSVQLQRTINVGVQSLYHGVLPLFGVIMLCLTIMTKRP